MQITGDCLSLDGALPCVTDMPVVEGRGTLARFLMASGSKELVLKASRPQKVTVKFTDVFGNKGNA